MALVSASKAVRCINQEILGMSSPNNLISQTIPQVDLIREANYQAGRPRGTLDFTVSPRTTGRLGIFAAKKNNQERGVMMLLPASGTPNRVLICITHGFEQAAKGLNPLGWGGDPPWPPAHRDWFPLRDGLQNPLCATWPGLFPGWFGRWGIPCGNWP